MANPPITIGPFTNVPAPGSPIKSDWPQALTTAVCRAPSILTMTPTLANGTYTTDQNVGTLTIPTAAYPRMVWIDALICFSPSSAGSTASAIDMKMTPSGIPGGIQRVARELNSQTVNQRISLNRADVYAIAAGAGGSVAFTIGPVGGNIIGQVFGDGTVSTVRGFVLPVLTPVT